MLKTLQRIGTEDDAHNSNWTEEAYLYPESCGISHTVITLFLSG